MRNYMNLTRGLSPLLLCLFFACSEPVPEHPSENKITEFQPDSISDIWIYNHPISMPEKIRENTELDLEETVKLINAASPEALKTEVIKQSGDTLFTRISGSHILSQQMGTTGADSYLSVATYALTEIEGIRYIHFNFPEGDHAIPGYYSREFYEERYRRFIENNPQRVQDTVLP